MRNHLLAASRSAKMTFQKVHEPASSALVASDEFVYDAPEIKSATVIMADSAPISSEFEQMIGMTPPSKPRSVLIFVGALFISIVLIVSAIIATVPYL